MSTEEKKGPEFLLDQAISEIRSESVDDAQARRAADRVWARLAQEPAIAGEPETIRSCADFQALIPAWREKRLSAARAMLFEDHLHECPDCRKVVAGEKLVEFRKKQPAITPVWRWAAAAGIVAAVGLGAWMLSDFAVPGGTGPRATVYAMDGALYRVSNGSAFQLAKGAGINEAERVRTTKTAGAVLRLRDGSLVEMAERTELSVSQRRAGVTIHLDRGAVIVQAAKQRSGHLFVATDDCTVSVKGTIFSVNHGMKGSRVTVVEGEVHVEGGSGVQVLHAGDQVATSDTLTPVPADEELAWSRDIDKYAALMKDFAVVRAKVEALPGPALRYESRLIDLVPANTQFFASIPNIGQTVAEAHRIFREQMAASPAMQQWWAERMKSAEGDAKFSQALGRIRSFSDLLGPEIVVALAPNAAGKVESPLIMAQTKSPMFRQQLDAEVKQINTEAGHAVLRIVDDPFQAAPAGDNEMLIYAGNGIAAMAKDLALLQAVAQPAAAGAFRGTAFGVRVLAAYREGVSWLFCADMQSVIAGSATNHEGLQASGLGDIRYFVAQRKDIAGKTENRAELSFARERQGIASWLAEPAPIRALDFVSQDASFAAAFAIKDPKLAIEDVFRMSGTGGGDFLKAMADIQAKTGVNVRDELIAPLGGEIAVTLDGPMLPVPGIKVIVEVTDPGRLVTAFEKLVATANTELTASSPTAPPVQMLKEQVNGKDYWRITGLKGFEMHFTFDNSFLIAAPTRDLVVRAVDHRKTGYSLVASPKFQALLPRDGHTNFSGLTYHAIGSALQPLTGRTLTPEQQETLKGIAGDTPTLVLFYGAQDRIEIASRGTFFGLRPEQLMGLPGLGLQKSKGRTQRWSRPS
ncbi:MAG TPA: FecR domain-containing protein [Bryobacteraceae bacterium]|nr:FecR domain-containing protein [Bryobacteraceae bacterium]